jgi:endonuclease YncB( thermonuclease family)
MSCIPSLFSCWQKKQISMNYEDTVPFVPPIKKGKVIKVYDGDTITIAAKLPYSKSLLYRFQVRLLGIDSPEMKGHTEEEKTAAHNSQRALEALVLHNILYLENTQQEKYGRILSDIFVIRDGKKIHINKWIKKSFM